MRLGTQELLIVLVIVVIIFGPTQLPKLFRMFGKSIKGFREGMNEDDTESTEKTAEKKEDV